MWAGTATQTGEIRKMLVVIRSRARVTYITGDGFGQLRRQVFTIYNGFIAFKFVCNRIVNMCGVKR